MRYSTGRTTASDDTLYLAPLAFFQAMFMANAGDTEAAGLAVTREPPADADPATVRRCRLTVERFHMPAQRCTAVTAKLDDAAVSDYAADCAVARMSPERYMRIWAHTHPGTMDPTPSTVDEATFANQYVAYPWFVMLIFSRDGRSSARLRVGGANSGLSLTKELKVRVLWEETPAAVRDPAALAAVANWPAEYAAAVTEEPPARPVWGPTGGRAALDDDRDWWPSWALASPREVQETKDRAAYRQAVAAAKQPDRDRLPANPYTRLSLPPAPSPRPSLFDSSTPEAADDRPLSKRALRRRAKAEAKRAELARQRGALLAHYAAAGAVVFG